MNHNEALNEKRRLAGALFDVLTFLKMMPHGETCIAFQEFHCGLHGLLEKYEKERGVRYKGWDAEETK